MEKNLETIEETPVLTDIAEPVEVAQETQTEEPSTHCVSRWIRNEAEGTKKCDACGAVMRGWAYREKFEYCPKCGAKAQIAM